MLIPSVRVNKVHNSKGSPSLPMANLIAWWSFFLCFVQNTKLSQHTAAKMPCLWLKTVVPAGGPGDDLRAFLSNGPLRARTEAAQQRERERARGQGSRPAGPAGARLPRAGRIPRLPPPARARPQAPAGCSLGSDTLKAQGALFRRR